MKHLILPLFAALATACVAVQPPAVKPPEPPTYTPACVKTAIPTAETMWTVEKGNASCASTVCAYPFGKATPFMETVNVGPNRLQTLMECHCCFDPAATAPAAPVAAPAPVAPSAPVAAPAVPAAALPRSSMPMATPAAPAKGK